MIQIEVNRYTLKRLEEALGKYNAECPKGYSKGEYYEIINWLLEKYLSEPKKKGGKK